MLAFFCKTKDLKFDRYRTLTGPMAINPCQKFLRTTQTREHSASSAIGSKHESLILAQNERWRQASNMQV